MKLLSHDVRGLGVNVKKRTIRNLIVKEGIELACFQETKLETFSNNFCS